MAITELITQPPIKINANGSEERLCNVIAAESQVPFEYLRRDEIILAVSEGSGPNAGLVQITLGGAPSVALTQGELLYVFVKSLNSAPDINGEYVIVDVPGGNALVISAFWGGSYDTTSTSLVSQPYFNRLSKFSDYRFKFRFKEAVTDQLLFNGTEFSYRSANTGKVFADFSRIFRGLAQRNDFRVQPEVAELINGSTSSFSSTGLNEFLLTEGQMQLEETDAPAMSSRLLFKQTSTYTLNVFGLLLNQIQNSGAVGIDWLYAASPNRIQVATNGTVSNTEANVFSKIGQFGTGDTIADGSILRITITYEIDAVKVDKEGLYGWELYGRQTGGSVYVKENEYFNRRVSSPETGTYTEDYLFIATDNYDGIGFRWGGDLEGESQINIRVFSIIAQRTDSTFPFLTRFNSELNRNQSNQKRVYAQLYEGYNNKIGIVRDSELTTRTGAVSLRARVIGLDINFANPGPETTVDLSSEISVNVFNIKYNAGNHAYYSLRIVDQLLEDLTGDYYFQYVQEKDQCKNSVMIEWRNSLSGNSQWLFSRRQDFDQTVEAGAIFKSPITSRLSESQTAIGREANTTNTTMQIVAEGLSFTQLQALTDIKSSRQVRLWLTKSGQKFVDVIVENGFVTSYENLSLGAKSYSFEVTLSFPDNFNIYNDQDFIREFLQPPLVSIV